MSNLNFDNEVNDLYKKYLQHCIEVNETPTGDQFFSILTDTVRRMFAVKTAVHTLAQGNAGQDVLYISYRTTDLKNPAGATAIKQCGQCGHDVYTDPAMDHILEKTNAVICNRCLPEITGMEMKDVIGGGYGQPM